MRKKRILIIVVVIVFIGLCVGGYFILKDGNVSGEGDQGIKDVVKDITEKKQNNFILTDVDIREFGATNIVSGKIENTQNKARTVEITLKMYNTTSSKTLGVNSVIVELEPNSKKDFEIGIMGDYTTVDNYELLTKDITESTKSSK